MSWRRSDNTSPVWFEIRRRINPGLYEARVDGERHSYAEIPTMLGRMSYNAGDLVPGVFVNGDEQNPLLFQSRNGNRLRPGGLLISTAALWPFFRQGTDRRSRSSADAAPPGTDPTPFVVSQQDTSYLRASKQAAMQIGASIWVWKPSNTAMLDPDNVSPSRMAYDEETRLWFVLLGAQLGAYKLDLASTQLHEGFLSGGNFGVVTEPLLLPESVGATSRKLWVVDTSGLAAWTWKQIKKDDRSTVEATVGTDWLNWTGVTPLPHSVDGQGNRIGSPICFYDSPWSRPMYLHTRVPVHESMVSGLSDVDKGAWDPATTYSRTDRVTWDGRRFRSWADHNRGNQPDTSQLWWEEVQSNDAGGNYVISAPNLEFLNMVEDTAYDVSSGDWGRQMARSQLLCVDPRTPVNGKAKVVWGLNGRDVGSNPTVRRTESYTPLLVSRGRMVLHQEGAEFRTDMQPFRRLKIQLDVKQALADLPTTYWQSFRERTWNNEIPAPPWAWRSGHIASDIGKLLRQYAPAFHEEEYIRDWQSKTFHGLEVRDGNSGSLIADTQDQPDFQPLEETPGVAKTARQYVDIGALDGSRHLMFSLSGSPFVMSGTARLGAGGAGESNIRKILNLREGQYCVWWFALEEYESDYWGCYDYRFLRAYYGDTGSPLGDEVTIDGMNGDPEFPQWMWDEVNRRAVEAWRQAYNPESGWTEEQWMALLRYRIVPGYHQVGTRNVFYQGRAKYCVDAGANGLTWDEGGVTFANYKDPIGRYSRYTRSVQYWAWCVRAVPAECTMLPMDHGWDWANCVADDERIFFMPRIPIRPAEPPNPDQPSPWKPVMRNNPPSLRRDDPYSASPEPWPAPPEWSSPAGDITPTLLCRGLGDLGIRWQRQWTKLELPLTHPPVAATWRGYLYVLMAGKLWKFSCMTGQTLASVSLPQDVNAATWTHADLAVVTGQVDLGGDGGLVGVPMLAVTGPDGRVYTATDITNLTSAIGTHPDVMANSASQHARVHTVISHLGAPAQEPVVDTVMVANAGGWQFRAVADVLGTVSPTINGGTC